MNKKQERDRYLKRRANTASSLRQARAKARLYGLDRPTERSKKSVYSGTPKTGTKRQQQRKYKVLGPKSGRPIF